MIGKTIPKFSFLNPTKSLDLRLSSITVVGATRRIRAVWDPEFAQDLMTFQNLDAEAELTALLGEQMRNEIDRQIIQDIHDNNRFYQQHNLNEALNRWNQLIEPIGQRAPLELNPPNVTNPFTIWTDTMIENQNYLTEFMDFNNINLDYSILPNEEGWYSKGIFDSLFIKMDMKPFRFFKKRRGRRF